MAEDMLFDLDAYGGLEVVLVPAPEPKHHGHSIRVCQSQNAPWFRKFTNEYQVCYGREKRARPKFIDKRRVRTALEKIVADRARGVYCERLIAWIEREIRRERYRRRIEREITAGVYADMPF